MIESTQALKDFEENVSGGCTTLASCEYNAWHLIKVTVQCTVYNLKIENMNDEKSTLTLNHTGNPGLLWHILCQFPSRQSHGLHHGLANQVHPHQTAPPP